jgi:hypothetical protein
MNRLYQFLIFFLSIFSLVTIGIIYIEIIQKRDKKYDILNKVFPYGNFWIYPLFFFFTLSTIFMFFFVPSFALVAWLAIIKVQGIEFADPNNMMPVINTLSIFNWQSVGAICGVYFFSSLIMDGYRILRYRYLFHPYPTEVIEVA